MYRFFRAMVVLRPQTTAKWLWDNAKDHQGALSYVDFRQPMMMRRWKPLSPCLLGLASLSMNVGRDVPNLLNASLMGWLGSPILPAHRSRSVNPCTDYSDRASRRSAATLSGPSRQTKRISSARKSTRNSSRPRSRSSNSRSSPTFRRSPFFYPGLQGRLGYQLA